MSWPPIPGVSARRRLVRGGVIAALLLATAVASAQTWRRYNRRYRMPQDRDLTDVSQRGGVPRWENEQDFRHDVFTFARVQYTGRKWATDFPDSDLNLSYRLQELTSLKVDPDGTIVRLDQPELLDYPFLYLIEPGDMRLRESEVVGLRRYLLNGGFLMVDDFWGDWEWQNFEAQMQRVFPDRPLLELPLEHPIFHCVYDLTQKPQIPSIHHYMSGRRYEGGFDGRTPHYRGLFDDDGRLMAIVCHNTDLGDGWEREGVDEGYFREYSQRWAYPMGINIVTYAMTH